MYYVVVEYESGTKTYEFSNLESAVEACKYAIKNGVKASILDEKENILVIK